MKVAILAAFCFLTSWQVHDTYDPIKHGHESPASMGPIVLVNKLYNYAQGSLSHEQQLLMQYTFTPSFLVGCLSGFSTYHTWENKICFDLLEASGLCWWLGACNHYARNGYFPELRSTKELDRSKPWFWHVSKHKMQPIPAIGNLAAYGTGYITGRFMNQCALPKIVLAFQAIRS